MGKIDITKTIAIDATADKLWAILSDDFLSVGDWSSTVDSSQHNPAARSTGEDGVPTGRFCVVPGFGETDERITHHNAKSKTLSYSVSAKELPGFVKGMLNTWSVRSLGPGQSSVAVRIRADATGVMGTLMGPMMKMKFGSTAGKTISDLKTFAETGQPSKAKANAVAKAS